MFVCGFCWFLFVCLISDGFFLYLLMYFFANSSEWTEKDEKVWGKSKKGRPSGQEMILLNGLKQIERQTEKILSYKDNFLMWGRFHLNSFVHFYPFPFPILWALCFLSFLLAVFFQLACHKVSFKHSSQWCLGIVVPIWCSY